jgi:hypothetical protein
MVPSMRIQELGKFLVLPVRFCIAQYADEVRSYISRYWVSKGQTVPDLSTVSSEQFARLNPKIRVESVTSATWKNRFTDFASLFLAFTAKTFRSSWLFPRILQAVIAEINLSDVQVKECLLPLFLHQAHTYGRFWDNDRLAGFAMFGIDQDTNAPLSSSLVDAGLLTLVHPKVPNRAVSAVGRLVLLSRSWTSIPRPCSTSHSASRRGSSAALTQPSWAKPFFDGLIWLHEFEFAHIPDRLGEPIARSATVPTSTKRIFINAFMTVVLCALYCRLEHIKSVCKSQNYDAFRTLLCEGCEFGDDLFKAELTFFDGLSKFTKTNAREILAFYQSGLLGLHSSEAVYQKIRKLPVPQAVHIKQLLQQGTFHVDQHWLSDRRFMQQYRAKLVSVVLPDWVDRFVETFSTNQTRTIMLQLNHSPALWIIPRFKNEDLEICFEEIPRALRNRVKPVLELPETLATARPVDELDSFISHSEIISESFEIAAVLQEEEDIIVATACDECQIFEGLRSTDVVDVDQVC